MTAGVVVRVVDISFRLLPCRLAWHNGRKEKTTPAGALAPSISSLARGVRLAGGGAGAKRRRRGAEKGFWKSYKHGGHGINVGIASAMVIQESTVNAVENLSGNGMSIAGASQLTVLDGSTVLSEQNNGHGLGLFSSSAIFVDSASTLTLRNNSARGLSVWNNASAQFQGTVLAENNTGHGLAITHTSTLFVGSTGTLTSRGNQGVGLRVDNGSADISGASITNNLGGADIRASFGARLTLGQGNTIGSVVCTTTVLSRDQNGNPLAGC